MYLESRVEEAVVPYLVFQVLMQEVIVAKYSFIGSKYYQCAIVFRGACFFVLLRQYAALELCCLSPSFAIGGYLKILTQCIYSLGTYTVKPDRFLKGFTIIFSTGIYLTHHIYHLAQRYATSKITNSDAAFRNSQLYTFSLAHGKLVYAVVHHLFYQHIDTIIYAAAIAQLAYVHTRT